MNHSWTARIAILALVLVLTGCVAPAPAPEAVASASSSPSIVTPSAPVTEALVLSGTGLEEVATDGTSLARLDFVETPQAAVAFLSDAVDSEPTVSTEDQDCAGTVTIARWADALVVKWFSGPDPAPGTYYEVYLGAPALGEVELRTSSGQQVGDDVTDFVAALPSDQVYADAMLFMFDVTGTDVSTGAPQGGWAAYGSSGLLERAAAPGGFSSAFC